MGWVTCYGFLAVSITELALTLRFFRWRTGHQSTWKSDWQRLFFVGELGKSKSANPTVGIYVIYLHHQPGLPLEKWFQWPSSNRKGAEKNPGNLHQHNRGPTSEATKPSKISEFPRGGTARGTTLRSACWRGKPAAAQRGHCGDHQVLKRLHGAWFGVWVYMIR